MYILLIEIQTSIIKLCIYETIYNGEEKK